MLQCAEDAGRRPQGASGATAEAKRRLKERITIELDTLNGESIVERGGFKLAHEDFPELSEEEVGEVIEIVVEERRDASGEAGL